MYNMKLLLFLFAIVAVVNGLPQGRSRGRGLRRFDPKGLSPTDEAADVVPEETPEPEIAAPRRLAARPQIRARINRNQQKEKSDVPEDVVAPTAVKSTGNRRRLRIPQTLKPAKISQPKEDPESDAVHMKPSTAEQTETVKTDSPVVEETKEVTEKTVQMIETTLGTITPRMIKPLPIKIIPRRTLGRSNKRVPQSELKETIKAEENNDSSFKGTHRLASPRIRGRNRNPLPATSVQPEPEQPMEPVVQERPSRRRFRPIPKRQSDSTVTEENQVANSESEVDPPIRTPSFGRRVRG